MDNNPIDQGDFDSESFEQWLGKISESKNLSQDEILNRMISAYWIFDELADMMPRSEEGDVDDSESFGRDIEGELERISEQLDSIEDVFQVVLPEIEELEEQQETYDGEIDDLRSQFERIRREISGSASQEEVNSLSTRLSQTESKLSKQLERTRADVSTDFENIHDILEYLVEKTDNLEARTDALAQAYNEDIVPLLSLKDELSATADLKDEANRHGIRKASCERCEKTIDIPLLTRPRCPHCESQFSDVSPKSGFFGSNTLEIARRHEEKPSTTFEVSDDSDKNTRTNPSQGHSEFQFEFD